jgi:probable F420-dependent oxidoreductase
MKRFRFGAMGGRAENRQQWLEQVRLAEDLGYSTILISDHFSDRLAPLPALAMAAAHTSLRLGTLVLANDFRHPAVLAKEAATVDLLSDGRLELGLGTGWEEGDYRASGIRRDPPGVQVDRLVEAISVLRGLWSPEEFHFDGDHYQIHLDGLPKPKEGRPTLLIGGGGERMLALAGRDADIVGISAAEIVDRGDLARGITTAGEVMDEKISWIRAGADARFDDLELNILLFGVEVGDRAEGAVALADEWGGTPEGILVSPHFLVGTSDEIAGDLEARRERWGISYPVVPFTAWRALAPVVERLTGT